MNAKKRALGKGLSALLDNSGVEAQPVYDAEKDLLPVGTIGKVPLDLIESNPYQPRTDFDEESLKELAASIKEQGVIQPVTVRKANDGKLQLIAGERRFKATRMAGLSDIPAYIITATDHSMLEMAIVENIQREDLNPVEIALGYKQLLQEYQLTQEMLSERLGKSRSSIANYLRLLNLPSEIQLGLRQDLISAGHARALLAIGDIQIQMEVYQDIIAEGLSVRDVEEIVRTLSSPVEEETDNQAEDIKTKVNPYPEEELQMAEKDLSYLYDSKVRLKVRSNGKGSIVIGFSTHEDLDRILSLLKK
jgi:ParB family transcriptional regulator, chromosome partitioning protein